MVPVALRLADIPPDRKAHDVTRGAAAFAGDPEGPDRPHQGAAAHRRGHCHLRRDQGGGDRPQDHVRPKGSPGLFCRGADRCGRLYRRPSTSRSPGPPGAAGGGAAAFWRSRKALSPLSCPCPAKAGTGRRRPKALGGWRRAKDSWLLFPARKRRNNKTTERMVRCRREV